MNQLNGITGPIKSQKVRSNMHSSQCNDITIFLTISRVIHILVQQRSLCRKPVIIPFLFHVNQCPLSGAIHIMLNP